MYLLSATGLLLLFLFERIDAQSHGDLRLVQQNIDDGSFSAGRLEIFINSTWGSICADNFNLTDANVACRQMGFAGAILTETSFHTRYGRGREGPIWLDEVNCNNQNLLHILSCSNAGIGEHDCDHYSDVAVECLPNPLLAQAQDNEVRLVGGEFRSQGRVEVYCNGEWGTICSQNFRETDANAICVQLGFTAASNYGTAGSHAIENSQQPIWVQEPSCPNSASDSASFCGICNRINHNHSSTECSSHSSDITVQCVHTVPYGSLRLAQGTAVSQHYSEGRLEIFLNGKWGTVCSNTFNQVAADVSCIQLGYIKALAYGNSVENGFGMGSGPISLTGVQCKPQNQLSLALCSVVAQENCSHQQDTAVFCINVPPTTEAPHNTDSAPIPTATLIYIVLGTCLVVTLCCICCAVYIMHFNLVPYSVKKEPAEHGLYFIERSGSVEMTETDIDKKLHDLESNSLGRRYMNKITDDPPIKRKERYVKFPTAAMSPISSHSTIPTESSVPLPQLGSQLHNQYTLSPEKLLSPTSLSSFTSQTPQTQPSLSPANLSPPPSGIPLPPPLRRQMEKNKQADDNEPTHNLSQDEVKKQTSPKHKSFHNSQATSESDEFDGDDDNALKGSTSSINGSEEATIQYEYRLTTSSESRSQTLTISKPRGIIKTVKQSETQNLPPLESISATNPTIMDDQTLATGMPQSKPTHANRVSFRLD